MFSNEGNQRQSMVSSILQLISFQVLLLTLSANCQRYPTYNVPFITSGIDRLYNPLYSPPPPPPMSYGNSYGPAVYGVQSSQPTYQPNYSPALSSCQSYYCYRSALPLTAGSTTTVAPPPPPTTQGPCGNRNFLVCVAENLASTALAVASSPYQYQAYQKQNVCPAYFCRVVTTTAPTPPATAAPDACDAFECEIADWTSTMWMQIIVSLQRWCYGLKNHKCLLLLHLVLPLLPLCCIEK